MSATSGIIDHASLHTRVRGGAYSATVRMSLIIDGVSRAVAQSSDDMIMLAPSADAALDLPCRGELVLGIDAQVQRWAVTLHARGACDRAFRATFAAAAV